jgi:hypothetical protein
MLEIGTRVWSIENNYTNAAGVRTTYEVVGIHVGKIYRYDLRVVATSSEGPITDSVYTRVIGDILIPAVEANPGFFD